MLQDIFEEGGRRGLFFSSEGRDEFTTCGSMPNVPETEISLAI